MNLKKSLVVALTASALVFPAAAQARGTDNQTKATLAGAAVGAALSGAAGANGSQMLMGAVAGGLAGNAYAYHNKKMNQADNRSYRPYKKVRHVKGHRHHHKRYHKVRYDRDRDDDWDD